MLGIEQVTVLLGLSLANYALRGLRWHVHAGALKLRTTLVQDMRHFLGGFAMTLTPGRLGELVRLRWIARETGVSLETASPLVLVDRAADLASVGLLLALCVALSTVGIAGGLPVALVAVAVSIAATRPILLQYLVTLAYRLLGFWPRPFARLRHAARSLQPFSTFRVAPMALCLGAAGWFCEGYAFYLLLNWLGHDLGVWTAVGIFLFAMMTGGATGMPGGLGGAEAAMIGLLGLQGVPLAISIPATAIIRLTTLWFAVLVGLMVFPLAEKASRQGQYALERS
jgi:glycosyltransferase 2 family protein